VSFEHTVIRFASLCSQLQFPHTVLVCVFCVFVHITDTEGPNWTREVKLRPCGKVA
jgi:hypothetical protein